MAERWRVALGCRLGLLAIGAALTWWRIRLLGDVRQHLGAFFGWFAVAFAAYLAAVWLVRRGDASGAMSRRSPGWSLAVIAAGAVLFRLTLLGVTPTLSNDIYRYRWDGRVQQAGFDPYAYPPDAPELASLRDEAFDRLNFPHLRTVYPPLMQLAFRLGVEPGDHLAALKAVFVAAEMVMCLALLLMLRARGQSPLWIVAYVWHPLPILEIAGSGHNDALAIALLWMGLAAWEPRHRAAAAVSWALAFLAKYASAILLPWWWLQQAQRRWIGLSLAVAALPLVVKPSAMTALIESLSAVSSRIESNASAYLLLWRCLGDAAAARWVAIGLAVAGMCWLGQRERDPVGYLMKALAVVAVLTPALHPWYLVWLVPCFVFRRSSALVALTGTVVLAYAVWPVWLAGGVWSVPMWARVLEYAPPAMLAMWGAARGRRRCASG